MTEEEAFAKAEEELHLRRSQMTQDEFIDAVVDRARELLGWVPLARLRRGRRLDKEELKALTDGIDMMLNDYTHVIRYGDARLLDDGWVDVLFRLVVRPDIPLIISQRRDAFKDFHEIGRSAGVRAYDNMDPRKVSAIVKNFPLKP